MNKDAECRLNQEIKGAKAKKRWIREELDEHMKHVQEVKEIRKKMAQEFRSARNSVSRLPEINQGA